MKNNKYMDSYNDLYLWNNFKIITNFTYLPVQCINEHLPKTQWKNTCKFTIQIQPSNLFETINHNILAKIKSKLMFI